MKILVLIITFISTVFIHAQNNSALEYALTAYDGQDFQTALIGFSKCIESDSSHILCHEKALLCAYKIGDFSTSKTLAIQLEKKDSFNLISLSQLAAIYELENNAPLAIKYYLKLIKSYPKNAFYFRKLAQQYQSANLVQDAFINYGEAIKLNDRDLLSLKGLAEIYLMNNHYVEADSILNKALSQDSTNITMHFLIAQSKYRQKQYEETVYYLEKTKGRLDLSPYYNKLLGYSYMQIDSLDQAIFHLEKSLTDKGNKEHAHYYLATAYEKKENPEYAKFHYAEAIKAGISENIDLYHRSLGRIFDRENNLKEAIPHYHEAHKYGNDPLIYYYLARASDTYYKDKTIAMRYYTLYINSMHNDQAYQNHAIARRRYLKEQLHLQN